MDAVTLFQFELCPYCHKVKAGLEAKGIPYTKVEVNPMNKKELPPLPEGSKKKVPVVQHEGQTIEDSTEILTYLEKAKPQTTPFLPTNEEARKKTETVEQWVDDDLTFVLPTVIYGTWGEAFKAAQVTARTSNFGPFQNVMVRGGGSLIMHQVAKKIVKKRGGTDPHTMLKNELDKFEGWLGEGPFICGEAPSLGDIAAHGAFTCIKEFPAFRYVRERPQLSAWYDRVDQLRQDNRVN